MAADLDKWPHNPASTIVDPSPNWRQCNVFTGWTEHQLAGVDRSSLIALMKINVFEELDPQTQEAVRAKVLGAVSPMAVLTPVTLISLADQANKNETARAQINVAALFEVACAAISSGVLSGTTLTARDKIDLLKWLGNKAISDSKSQDSVEVVQRVDRGRKRASDFTADELKSLSKTELLDLLA